MPDKNLKAYAYIPNKQARNNSGLSGDMRKSIEDDRLKRKLILI